MSSAMRSTLRASELLAKRLQANVSSKAGASSIQSIPRRRYHSRHIRAPGESTAPRCSMLAAYLRSAPQSQVGSYSRGLHTSPALQHGHITRPEPGTGIKVKFIDAKGELLKQVEVNEGDDILAIAQEHDIDLEGACEGSIACSTCHVILSPEQYDMLPEASDEENDMLDMAFGLTDTSRLGCQIKMTKDLDGIVCQLPSATRNMFVDGHKPARH